MSTRWVKIVFAAAAAITLVNFLLANSQIQLIFKQHRLNTVPFIRQTIWRFRDLFKTTALQEEQRTAKGLTNVGNGTFYIYSVVAHQSVWGTVWDKFYVTGWGLNSTLGQEYKCCLLHANGTHVLDVSSYKVKWIRKDDIQPMQVVCVSKTASIEARPKWASLVLDFEACSVRKTFHKIVYRPQITKPAFAICAKVIYRKKDPRYLIEWMEYHKYMGASKVVIYVYVDVHESARKVLKYYVDEGFLETVGIPVVPFLDKYPRHFAVPNTTNMWQDEKIPIFDTEQRLRPYTYYAVIDTDEFIVPRQTGVKTLVALMEYLLAKYKTGASFIMKTENHIMNWNKTNLQSDLMIEQYGYRTIARIAKPKLFHVTDRVREGSVWIHQSTAKQNYTVIKPSAEDDVVLKHFRKCYAEWTVKDKVTNKTTCNVGPERHHDTYMEDVARVIRPQIRRVKKLLGF